MPKSKTRKPKKNRSKAQQPQSDHSDWNEKRKQSIKSYTPDTRGKQNSRWERQR